MTQRSEGAEGHWTTRLAEYTAPVLLRPARRSNWLVLSATVNGIAATLGRLTVALMAAAAMTWLTD